MTEAGGWRRAAEREFLDPFEDTEPTGSGFADGDWPDLPEPTFYGVVNWRTLTDTREPDAWRTLTEWVTWLCDRYTITARLIPDCWYQHDGIVEELSALFSSWEMAFDEADSGGHGPLGWHERFEYFRARLRHYKPEGCANGHLDVGSRTLPHPPDLITRFEHADDTETPG